MESSIKINSISIDLADAANEIDMMIKCDHFSIRGFVGETREREHRKCWPFSEESVSLMDQQSYYNVPKFRWWRCMSCIRDIDTDGTKGNDVNCERSHKEDERASPFLKKEKQNVDEAVTTYGSSEIAGVVDDTPPKAIKNHKGSRLLMESDTMNGLQPRKTRKVRLLSELLGKAKTKTKTKTSGGSNNIRKGRKRKLSPENNYVSRILGATCENASKSCDSESTDSGRIKGKQKNTRFQVVDEFLPCDTSQDPDADPGKSSLSSHVQRRESKVSLGKKKKKNKSVIDNKKSTLISFSIGMDKESQVKQTRDAEANCLRDFGSSSKSNTGGWLRTGVDVVEFSSNNNITNRFQLGHISSSALQKDASDADRKEDEIPMEIVELMAKNQYERCLPDKEEDVTNKQPSHRSKNALLIDLNETYHNGMSLEDNSNVRNEEHSPIGQEQKSLDFFPISHQPFGIFPPTQENRANSIRFSDHNCQWLGNVPTMANQNPSPSSFRVLRACNTCQSSVPNPIWPSSMIPPHGHQKPVSFISQASSNDRSMDAFSNESSIPALHLLSLMDPRVRSNHGNAKVTKRHFQSKECVEIQTGDSSNTTYPTKQLPFDFYSKRFTPETSPLGTSSFSFQNAQEKQTKRKDTFGPVYTSHEKSLFASSNDQGKFQLLGASNSMMLPLKFHMTGREEKKQKRKAERCSNASAWPLKNTSGPIICSINRNPADFTIPEPGNVYMLTGENLKVRKNQACVSRTH